MTWTSFGGSFQSVPSVTSVRTLRDYILIDVLQGWLTHVFDDSGERTGSTSSGSMLTELSCISTGRAKAGWQIGKRFLVLYRSVMSSNTLGKALLTNAVTVRRHTDIVVHGFRTSGRLGGRQRRPAIPHILGTWILLWLGSTRWQLLDRTASHTRRYPALWPQSRRLIWILRPSGRTTASISSDNLQKKRSISTSTGTVAKYVLATAA